MKDDVLSELAQRLEQRGHDPGQLQALQGELDSLERPRGRLKRLSHKAGGIAQRQWAHIRGEFEESAEAMSLVRRAVTTNEKLSPEDADAVKTQLMDLLRIVPASLIATVNFALPVPGTSMATPMILSRLGLLPSRWREAHLLSQLEKEVARLQAAGLEEEASVLEAIVQDIEDESDAREQILRDAELLSHWDANKNGVWDAEERTAYQEALASVVMTLGDRSHRKKWFLLQEGCVMGPIRLSDLDPQDLAPNCLVCWDGKSGWIALDDLLKAIE